MKDQILTVKLTEHFTLEEFTFSQTAVRNGIDNTPSKEIIENLKITANGMEQVRSILGAAINISSGYRCFNLNRIISKSSNSAHLDGYAADFICPAFGAPEQIVKKLKESGIKVDQCIMEGTWVHISFAPKMRNQFMRAKFINGVPQYSTF